MLLPYPLEQLCRRNKTQRQRHGHTIARMLQGTILKRPHKECRQFTHQQICGRGDDSDEKNLPWEKTLWSLVYYFTTCVKTRMRRYAALVRAYKVKSACVNFSSNALAAIQSDINYTEVILCDAVTCTLADSEIQLDLLGEKTKTWP